MKHLISIESFRELTLVTWDERVEGAERLRFSSPMFAEVWLRRFIDDPAVETALRQCLEASLSPSSATDDLDELLREVAERLVDKRLRVYERPLTRYFSDVPVGPDEPVEPPAPDDPDDPVEPADAKPTPVVTPPPRWELEVHADGEVDDDCFDASPLRLRARLVEGTAAARRATFVVLRDSAPVLTQEVDTADAHFEWEIALVRDDQTSWTLEFTFQYESDLYSGHRVLTVWPRTLLLRALHFRTAAPVQGFRFLVTQDGADLPAETLVNGEVPHPLAKPAPFTVSSEAPFVVRSWTSEVGRVREAKVERKYKAAFHGPVKPTPDKAIEQLVNAATADQGRDALGSKIVVRVGADGDLPLAPGARVGQQGDELHVKVLFARKSKRNSPLPAVSGLAGAKTVGSLTTGKVTLGVGGASAEFTLELGLAGGDECVVSVGVTPAADDQTLSFINWRKLFYQVSRPSTMALPSLARMTTCLEGIFARYEKYKEVAFTEADGPPAGAWFDGPMMGLAAGRAVCIGDHNKAHFHGKFVDTKNPLGVHVLLCHTQFDGGAAAHQSALSEVLAKTTHAKSVFPTTGASHWCHAVDITTVVAGANAFPKAIQDGADAVRAATWTSLAATGPHAALTGPIPADHVHIDWVNNRDIITIKLPAAAELAVDAGVSVRVNYTVLWALGEFLGESDGKRPNLQLIAELANDSTNDVMAHELGHTMKAVLKAVPPGLVATAHPRKYVGRGHQGPHCAFGATDLIFDDPTKNLGGIAACKCIMYGENGKAASVSNGSFCVKCVPFLSAEALQDITK